LSETIPIEQHVESVFSIHSLNQQELSTNPQSVGLQIDEYVITARKQRCQQLINLWITQFIDNNYFFCYKQITNNFVVLNNERIKNI